MPKKASVKGGSGAQVKGNNVKPGTAAPSALRGKDTNKWDVSGVATKEAEAQMDRAEPFIQQPLQGQEGMFPTIYGVDLKEKRRQSILKKVAEQGKTGPLGNRQVMLDDKTVDWIIREQDRIYLIEKDILFEQSGRNQGLFDNPSGLEYLHKINPGYFQRRKKMAKWLVKTQLKLFNVSMNGVQSEDDFNFMLMIQGLAPPQKKLIDTAAHRLPFQDFRSEEGVYQAGAWRSLFLPFYDVGQAQPGTLRQDIPFAGVTRTDYNQGQYTGVALPNSGRGLAGRIQTAGKQTVDWGFGAGQLGFNNGGHDGGINNAQNILALSGFA